MKKNRLPTISIVIATYNSSRTIGQCLQSIRDQEYPQEKIEVIVADGASTDETRSIASSYNVHLISVDKSRQNAEYNKSIGIAAARNEILAMIDHDNVLPHRLWLKNMVEPFMNHHEVVGVETLRYRYDPQTSLLDRYFALFGAGDPLVWYLGRADRLSYIYDQYSLAGQARDRGRYYLVRFRAEEMPTIGANGFLVRRRVLMDNAQAAPGRYFDMDVNVDLIRKGFDTYAFVKDSILHLTGYGNVWSYLKRRMLFMTQYRLSETARATSDLRRYGQLSKKDQWRLVWVILICITVVIPLYDSIRGWRKIRDNAWFLHPLLCVSFVILYGLVIIRQVLQNYAKRFLEQ